VTETASDEAHATYATNAKMHATNAAKLTAKTQR